MGNAISVTDTTNAKNRNPAKYCGAKTRAGGHCKAYAMPNGRCRIHGGNNPGRPIINGLYAVKHHQTLNEKVQKYLDAPIDDLTHELALVRALLQDYLEKIAASPSAKEREGVIALVNQITKIVSTYSNVRASTALTGAEIQLFILAMSGILKKYVSADDLPAALNELRTTIKVS